MDKYSVVLDNEKTKTASTSKTCPGCGGSLTNETHCARCGTKPFEKRPEPKK